MDITNASDFQTMSWSKFWYTDASHDHRLASLNGSGGGDHPEDWGHLRVTYHHNWFAALVDQRMPRVMYGEGHQFNNYYNSPGNSYCIGAVSYGSVLIESNYFKDVNDPPRAGTFTTTRLAHETRAWAVLAMWRGKSPSIRAPSTHLTRTLWIQPKMRRSWFSAAPDLSSEQR